MSTWWVIFSIFPCNVLIFSIFWHAMFFFILWKVFQPCDMYMRTHILQCRCIWCSHKKTWCQRIPHCFLHLPLDTGICSRTSCFSFISLSLKLRISAVEYSPFANAFLVLLGVTSISRSKGSNTILLSRE